MTPQDDANLIRFLLDLVATCQDAPERVGVFPCPDRPEMPPEEPDGYKQPPAPASQRGEAITDHRRAVHHINGDPYDQRPENLRIVPCWPVKAWWAR